MKKYRKILQKVAKTKMKLLCALRDADCREAAELLQTPVREEGARRCDKCSGCVTLASVGACRMCKECEAGQECAEHSRLCFSWRQPATTFVAGSVVTGVSSMCNLVEYDMGPYKDMLEKLSDASLDVETTLDDFPAGAEQRANERFSQTRRMRDLSNEEEQMLVIERLVGRYQEQHVQLAGLESEDEEVEDDAVEVTHSSPPEAFGLVSRTNTHYTFDQLPPPGTERSDDTLAGVTEAMGFDLNELLRPLQAVSPPRKPVEPEKEKRRDPPSGIDSSIPSCGGTPVGPVASPRLQRQPAEPSPRQMTPGRQQPTPRLDSRARRPW